MNHTKKIKLGDEVIVIYGAHKGKSGTVIKVIKETNRLIVSGVGYVVRHTKPTQSSQGGKIKKESSIHISNVAFLDSKTNKPSRVGFKSSASGSKARYLKKTGEIISESKGKKT